MGLLTQRLVFPSHVSTVLWRKSYRFFVILFFSCFIFNKLIRQFDNVKKVRLIYSHINPFEISLINCKSKFRLKITKFWYPKSKHTAR